MRRISQVLQLLLILSMHTLLQLTNAQDYSYTTVLEYENYATNTYGIALNSKYVLNILVWDAIANQIDEGTTLELISLGESPTVFLQTYYTLPHSQSFNENTIILHNNGLGQSTQARSGWFVAFDSTDAGITSLGIKSSGVGLGTIAVQEQDAMKTFDGMQTR
eukprot:TRINITY_DN2080_c0_g1_i1.p1 TRINITY_DN2080_c0_g1~~TRINITY_DN2080_c0_g1_i1.p1  ORF type:complete len:163 (-),score=35.58 TRINITY_DN2080_c0_g1_i1:205-693(-)